MHKGGGLIEPGPRRTTTPQTAFNPSQVLGVLGATPGREGQREPQGVDAVLDKGIAFILAGESASVGAGSLWAIDQVPLEALPREVPPTTGSAASKPGKSSAGLKMREQLRPS